MNETPKRTNFQPGRFPVVRNFYVRTHLTFTCGSEMEIMFEKVVRKRKGYATLEVHTL